MSGFDGSECGTPQINRSFILPMLLSWPDNGAAAILTDQRTPMSCAMVRGSRLPRPWRPQLGLIEFSNSLIAADAERVEEAFRAKLAIIATNTTDGPQAPQESERNRRARFHCARQVKVDVTA
jgi:hypothetical protein